MNDENHLYEYSVIRYVPAVEREEFVNIGLVMMCKRMRWIKMQLHMPDSKIRVFRSELPMDALHHQATSLSLIADADPSGGPIAQLPVEERFRWLTAVRSACIQTSRPHPGLTMDLDKEFDRIFSEQVI